MKTAPRLNLALALALPLFVSATAIAADPPVTRNAVAKWTKTAPKIDGKLDDPAWEGATVIEDFPSFWSKTDNGKVTRARILWDNEALYIGATMKDAELKSFGTKHNDTLWDGDVFEMFFKPSKDKPAYYEFQVNPKSLTFESAFPGKGADLGSRTDLTSLGMFAAAKVDGTRDKPGDVDNGWSGEVKIPWTAFKLGGGKPKPGEIWSFAFCRYDWGPKGTNPVLMSSAPLTQMNFHRVEDYGKLKFEGPVK